MEAVTLAQAYYALAAFLLLAGWLIVTDAAVLRTFRRSPGATYLLGLAGLLEVGVRLLAPLTAAVLPARDGPRLG